MVTAPAATNADATGSSHHHAKADVSVVPATVTRARRQPVAESHPSASSAWLGMRAAILRLVCDKTASATTDVATVTIPAGDECETSLLTNRLTLSATVSSPI